MADVDKDTAVMFGGADDTGALYNDVYLFSLCK